MLDLPRYPQTWQPDVVEHRRLEDPRSEDDGPVAPTCLMASMLIFVGTVVMAAGSWETFIVGRGGLHAGLSVMGPAKLIAGLTILGIFVSVAFASVAAMRIRAGWLLVAGEAVLGALLLWLMITA